MGGQRRGTDTLSPHMFPFGGAGGIPAASLDDLTNSAISQAVPLHSSQHLSHETQAPIIVHQEFSFPGMGDHNELLFPRDVLSQQQGARMHSTSLHRQSLPSPLLPQQQHQQPLAQSQTSISSQLQQQQLKQQIQRQQQLQPASHSQLADSQDPLRSAVPASNPLLLSSKVSSPTHGLHQILAAMPHNVHSHDGHMSCVGHATAAPSVADVTKDMKDTSACNPRNRTKSACVSCHNAKTACDQARPCNRCIRLNIAESCVDRPRRKRRRSRTVRWPDAPSKDGISPAACNDFLSIDNISSNRNPRPHQSGGGRVDFMGSGSAQSSRSSFADMLVDPQNVAPEWPLWIAMSAVHHPSIRESEVAQLFEVVTHGMVLSNTCDSLARAAISCPESLPVVIEHVIRILPQSIAIMSMAARQRLCQDLLDMGIHASVLPNMQWRLQLLNVEVTDQLETPPLFVSHLQHDWITSAVPRFLFQSGLARANHRSCICVNQAAIDVFGFSRPELKRWITVPNTHDSTIAPFWAWIIIPQDWMQVLRWMNRMLWAPSQNASIPFSDSTRCSTLMVRCRMRNNQTQICRLKIAYDAHGWHADTGPASTYFELCPLDMLEGSL